MSEINYAEFEGHTPGPWTVEHNREWCIVDSRNLGVADCMTSSSKRGEVTHEEVEPNARLIAAAPDLLSENTRLREVEQHMALARKESGCPDDDTLVMHCRELREQLEKAQLALVASKTMRSECEIQLQEQNEALRCIVERAMGLITHQNINHHKDTCSGCYWKREAQQALALCKDT